MRLTPWLKKNGVESDALAVAAGLTMDVEAGRLPSFHQALPRLELEVSRARRYERPFCVALVGTDDAETPSLVTLLLASLVREALREGDIVAYAPTLALCVVGLPEARRPGAVAAMERVRTLCLERLMLPVRIGIAEFPIKGWTLEGLVKEAEHDATREMSVTLNVPSTPPEIADAEVLRGEP
jgi:GGDEF domain-containing protein